MSASNVPLEVTHRIVLSAIVFTEFTGVLKIILTSFFLICSAQISGNECIPFNIDHETQLSDLAF